LTVIRLAWEFKHSSTRLTASSTLSIFSMAIGSTHFGLAYEALDRTRQEKFGFSKLIYDMRFGATATA